MNLNKHVYAIKRILSDGDVSDDTPRTDREIAHHLTLARATILRRELNKRNYISDDNYYTFCLDIVDGNITTCTVPSIVDITQRIGLTELPASITAKWGSLVKMFKPDGAELSKVSRNTAKNLQHSRVSSLEPAWYMFNNRPVFVNAKFLKSVDVQMIMEEPMDILDISTTQCTIADVPFPVDASLVPAIYELALRSLAPHRYPEDRLNNSSSIDADAQSRKN